MTKHSQLLGRRHFLRQCFLAGATLAAGTSALHAKGWTASMPLPNLAGFGLEGPLPKLSGKVVYLDFWASWCVPCKVSFPILNQWQSKYSPRGFTVLGVNIDQTVEAMQKFLKKTPVSFPVVRDVTQKLVEAANAPTMPTSFLIDRKGVISLMHEGFRLKDKAELEEKINQLLA